MACGCARAVVLEKTWERQRVIQKSEPHLKIQRLNLKIQRAKPPRTRRLKKQRQALAQTARRLQARRTALNYRLRAERRASSAGQKTGGLSPMISSHCPRGRTSLTNESEA